MTDVWLIETLDYPEDAYNVGIADTPEAAIAHLKRMYDHRYRVTWDDPVQDNEGDWEITAHHEHVRGLSTKHDTTYAVVRYPLITEVTP